MNPDTFPFVSEELVNALEETFPVTLDTLSLPLEKVREESGRQGLIFWLRQMHEAQINKDLTE